MANILDVFFEAGPKRILSEVSTNALLEFGIKVKSINFDTTSKVMWGEYESENGKIGAISIDFGHSKQKRNDKKQIKMAIGAANGVIVDADVLSGNEDDKNYNSDKIDQLEEILKRTNTSKEEFYYIADSAAFSEENLRKMKEKGLKFITRMPDNTNKAKELIEESITNFGTLEEVKLINAHEKEVVYHLKTVITKYKGFDINASVCYSKAIEEIKRKTATKNSDKEVINLNTFLKKYNKREFACMEDAEKEIAILRKSKEIKKIKYNDVDLTILSEVKRPRGRKSKSEENLRHVYHVNYCIKGNEEKLKHEILSQSTFILVSNDLGLGAYEMLKEYKTQSAADNKFKQLKSSHFVNSLFLKLPQRIEALSYLLLITLMILSTIEFVVRRKMFKEKIILKGPGDVNMKRFTLLSIARLMGSVSYKIIIYDDGSRVRALSKELREAQSKILDYLGLTEDIYVA